MSNRTQISCNQHNKELVQWLKQSQRELKNYQIDLAKVKVYEKDLIEEIIKLNKQGQRPAIQMVRLGRWMQRIREIELNIAMTHYYIKIRSKELIIC